MFILLWKKELKAFFSNKGNLIFMILLPIVLISIFSLALGDYIRGDYKTFDNGKVFYYQDNSSMEYVQEFERIKSEISESTGVAFIEVTDLPKAEKAVEESEAYGVITITEGGYDYFRSTFNEPQGGKIIRSLFEQMSSTVDRINGVAIKSVVVQGDHLDAKIYYTFSALTFAILFMGVLVGHSVINEKESGTIIRVQISKAGKGSLMAGKVLTGMLCGIGEICAAFLFSNFVLGVNWGKYLYVILCILLCLVWLSAVFGAVVGMLAANKSMCQSIIMMFAMLCGYLGGAITPLYLLENMPVLRMIVKISPLYWTNQALICLYNGILDEKAVKSAGVLLGLSVIVIVIYVVCNNRGTSKMRKEGAA